MQSCVSAARLCDGDVQHLVPGRGRDVAARGRARLTPEALEVAPTRTRAPMTAARPAGRAILDRADRPRSGRRGGAGEVDRDVGRRSATTGRVLAVPLLREGAPIGAIDDLARREVAAVLREADRAAETFADQAVIAIENVRLFQELQARNRELTEALEQQTATGEILAVISSSPMDLQPVFDVIVESAVRLCEGLFAVVFRFDGELVHFAADHGFTAEAREFVRRVYPLVPMPDNPSSRAILDRSVVNIPDILSDAGLPAGQPASAGIPERPGRTDAAGERFDRRHRRDAAGGEGRSPTGRSDSSRPSPARRSSPSRTCGSSRSCRRVTRSLRGALARQTATSEILQVISRSPTSAQPVFEAIVKSASRLLGGAWAGLTRLEGDAVHFGAYQLHGMPDDLVRDCLQTWPRSLDDETPAVVAVRTGQMLSMADAQTDPRGTAAGRAAAVAGGYRCFAVMPMMKDGRGDRGHPRRSPDGRALHRRRARAAPDIRRPGGDRHRERAAVPGAAGAQPRADRGAGAADGDQRGAEGHQPLDVRPRAGPGDVDRERDAAVRCPAGHHVPVGRRGVPRDGGLQRARRAAGVPGGISPSSRP